MKRGNAVLHLPLGAIADLAVLIVIVLMVLQVIPFPPVGECVAQLTAHLG